jgi:hypothetical protein
MSWNRGPSALAIIVACLFISFIDGLLRSYLDGQKLRGCEAEAEAEAKRRREIAERRRIEVEDKYKSIDEKTRNRLRALVEERSERLDLLIAPGDLESAVVRIFERSQVRESSRSLGNKSGGK